MDRVVEVCPLENAVVDVDDCFDVASLDVVELDVFMEVVVESVCEVEVDIDVEADVVDDGTDVVVDVSPPVDGNLEDSDVVCDVAVVDDDATECFDGVAEEVAAVEVVDAIVDVLAVVGPHNPQYFWQ